nr:DNA replication complex GINS protein PSF1 [Ipomoea batatas]
MYGKKGSELVKEVADGEPGQLAAYNSDLFTQVTEECNSHFLHLESLLRSGPIESSTSQPSEDADYYGSLIHLRSLIRNKRCLMAYVYNRAEVIRSLGWTLERVLPEEIEEKLSSSEKEYFKNHSKTIQEYMSKLDLDLGVDMVPPKDPYIKVRVLKDIGTVVLSDQLANLARHAILFLRRTDAEQYIAQGLMEELTS